MATFEKEKIIEQLESLKNLPQIKEVKALRLRLERELESLTEKEKPVIEEMPTEEKQILANSKRSSKGKRHWRFVKLIHDRFPNLKVSEIRRQLKRRKETGKSNISEAIWQNPSA